MLRTLTKFCVESLASQCFHLKPMRASAIQTKRFLFSADILGIESYKKQRAYNEEKTGHVKETFRTRMEDYMGSSENNTIFTDDLKTMVYIAKTEEDLETTVKMIKRFQKQSNDLRFSHFQFGPLVLRLMYVLNKPDLAYNLFTDQALDGFFDQMSSYRVLMDLLFEHQQYDLVMEVFSRVRSKNLGGHSLPVDCATIAMAACCKTNTEKSWADAKEILQEMEKSQIRIPARAIVYGAMLALSQNKPGEALEIMSLIHLPPRHKNKNVPQTNAKALIFCRLGRPEDAVLVLRSVIENDLPEYHRRNEVFEEVLQEVESVVASSSKKELQHTCRLVAKNLRDGGYMMDGTFDSFIWQPIYRSKKLQEGEKGERRYSGVPVDSQLHRDNRRSFSSSTYSIMRDHEAT